MDVLSSSMQMLRQCLKLGHVCFLPHPSELISHYRSTIWHCTGIREVTVPLLNLSRIACIVCASCVSLLNHEIQRCVWQHCQSCALQGIVKDSWRLDFELILSDIHKLSKTLMWIDAVMYIMHCWMLSWIPHWVCNLPQYLSWAGMTAVCLIGRYRPAHTVHEKHYKAWRIVQAYTHMQP
jgi:hypothetical protein